MMEEFIKDMARWIAIEIYEEEKEVNINENRMYSTRT